MDQVPASNAGTDTDPIKPGVPNTTTKLIQVPLCEYDYFRRIDLICFTCNKAIRGSYITAVGRKYHPEHFYCEICHKVFETEDYYEHEGQIYCHYHYSRIYAAHCESCKSAILKQYVEMHRGGKEQQWHPECFMIHKFWGVDVTVDCIGLDNLPASLIEIAKADEKVMTPKILFEVEHRLEQMMMFIWMTLSEFEESCAACISDMLHSATIDDKLQGLLAAGKLVLKIDCLFKGINVLNDYANSCHIQIDYDSDRYRSLSALTKEPRSLSSKLMSYLTFLRDTTKTKLATSKYSRELLSLISTMAHYIKLISRNSLMHALEYNRLTKSTLATDKYLREVSVHDLVPKDVFPNLEISAKAKDQCSECGKSIEARCFQFDEMRWHPECLRCSKCGKSLANSSVINELAFNRGKSSILCESCASEDVDAMTGFHEVSKYSQLVYLLKIALVRSKYAMQKRGLIEKHGKDAGLQPNDRYSLQVSDIKRMRSLRQNRKIGNATNEIRKSIILEAPEGFVADQEEADDRNIIPELPEEEEVNKSEEAPGNRTPKNYIPGAASHSIREIRDSDSRTNSIISAHSTMFLKKNRSLGRKGSKRLRIEDVPMNAKPTNVNLDETSNLLKNEKGLTLDDIPRIVSSEQAREYRPNAFRFQKRNYETAASTIPASKSVQKRISDVPSTISIPLNEARSRDSSIQSSMLTTEAENSTVTVIASDYPKPFVSNVKSDGVAVAATVSAHLSASAVSGSHDKRFSELTPIQHDYMRHVAAFSLHKILGDELTLEDCLSFIDIRKNPSFWGKIFGSSKKNSYNDLHKVFGVPLEAVAVKYGIDSDLGIGPEKLRIPTLVDELINAMHTKDLSAEGVFRLNGNIRRLKKLMTSIDEHPDAVPDLYSENAIQLAALLKKFARGLPNPLLTFKLYDVFILSQKFAEEPKKRDKILKLAYCMLPKVYRDLTEVLLSFLNWVATFSHIDEETGSKMDIHNLATVLTPNILYSRPKITNKMPDSADLIPNGENHFLAIEVVNTMIENHDDLSIIPTDLLKLYKKAGLDAIAPSKDGFTTKEIIAKCRAAYDKKPSILEKIV
ncbi:hypothetical protein FOA43_002786 [Brettanomyces nanus]|uniref:RhoGAP-domain-containing protein n=1 Tax=Eeniella nana TaxID=13502 RepID=A0A875S5Z5_EENNA|nr:uncharacterized protein FOA43_002786 [Brettanomyces nanus]QPG75432.1 hypothetical protein FOA43_002786 [Brettanomyces nanus]